MFACDVIDGRRDRLGPHDHSASAAVWGVIDLPVISQPEGAQRMEVQLDDSLLDRASDHSATERRLEHLWEQRDYVKLHCPCRRRRTLKSIKVHRPEPVPFHLMSRCVRGEDSIITMRGRLQSRFFGC